jgi:hypothetical protein
MSTANTTDVCSCNNCRERFTCAKYRPKPLCYLKKPCDPCEGKDGNPAKSKVIKTDVDTWVWQWC